MLKNVCGFCLCRAGVAWSVRVGRLLAASLSRSALLGVLRVLCAALSGLSSVVRPCLRYGRFIFLSCLRIRSAPHDSCTTHTQQHPDRTHLTHLRGAPPLSAALPRCRGLAAVFADALPAAAFPSSVRLGASWCVCGGLLCGLAMLYTIHSIRTNVSVLSPILIRRYCHIRG